jgi:hypothetical protein
MSDTDKIPERTFTLEEIKKAYWTEFHEAGEVFFSYSNEADSEETTESYWEDFVFALTGAYPNELA